MPYKAKPFKPGLRKTRDLRQSASRRGYDRKWQKYRKWYAGQEPPICTQCEKAPADLSKMHLDHKTPLRQGGAHCDPANSQWLCPACHARKTQRENRRTSSTAKVAGGRGDRNVLESPL